MGRSKRSMAAVKANQTRKARKQFSAKYPQTAEMAEDLMRGHSTRDVAEWFDVSVGTVAAVKANLNREGEFALMAFQCKY